MGINDDAYVPLKWLAERLGLNPGTIRHWRYRGWIDRKGEQRYVRVRDRRYNAADVIVAERDTSLNPQSHRERTFAAA